MSVANVWLHVDWKDGKPVTRTATEAEIAEAKREIVLASDTFESNNWSPLKQSNE